MKKTVLYAIFPCFFLCLWGCYDDLDLIGTDPLDRELELVLLQLDPDLGKNAFLLPEPDDFESIPQDVNNPLREEKVRLGKFLFHETKLAINPRVSEGEFTYSCASCHHAAAGFQSGLKQGIGEGGMGFGASGEQRIPNPNYVIDSVDKQGIRTPSALHVAYQENSLWNGQFGAKGKNVGTASQWQAGTPAAMNFLGYEGPETQAIAGLAVHRMRLDTNTLFKVDTIYNFLFNRAFPFFSPSKRYTNETAGLAIAAYERTLMATEAPFQNWIKGGTDAMRPEEKKGAILFFGKANCVSCHNNPALGSNEFFALGMDDLAGEGAYGTNSDDPENLGRGGFTGVEEEKYKFKVPQLYNLEDSRFFGHGASFSSLKEVVKYKNAGVASNPKVPASQLADGFQPLNLTDEEINQLTAFLSRALRDPFLNRYNPEDVPSGHCFPNNDIQSKTDLGCL